MYGVTLLICCGVVCGPWMNRCSLTSAKEKSHTDQESIFCYNSKQQPPRDTKSIYWELRWHVCIIKCYKKVPEIQFHQLIYCPCIQKQRNKQWHQASLHSVCGGFTVNFTYQKWKHPRPYTTLILLLSCKLLGTNQVWKMGIACVVNVSPYI